MLDTIMSVTVSLDKSVITGKKVDFTEGCIGTSVVMFSIIDEGKPVEINLDNQKYELHVKGSKDNAVKIIVPSTSFTKEGDLLRCELTEEVLNIPDKYVGALKVEVDSKVFISKTFEFNVNDTFIDEP